MAIPALISWNAPAHIHSSKQPDWYWSVGIITLAVAAVCVIFGQVISAILVVVCVSALVLVASKPPRSVQCQVNDRGVLVDGTLYPFVSLESFWIAHDQVPARVLIKSRKLLMPLIVILIDEVDPDDIRKVLLRYIAETEHHEPFLKHVLDGLGF